MDDMGYLLGGKECLSKGSGKRDSVKEKYRKMQTWYDTERHIHKTGGGYRMFGSDDSKYPVDWKERRAYIQTRDGNCTLCHGSRQAVGDYSVRNEVHHIIPISKGGTHEVENLVALCSVCHEDQHEHLLQRRISMYKNSKKRHSKYFPKWHWIDNTEKRLKSLVAHKASSSPAPLHVYSEADTY